MSNAALAFLAGMGGGYMTEKNRQEERDRQDKRDQREQDEHDARMAKFKQEQDAVRALREAGQPLTVNDGATVTGVAATPTTYDSADVAASDVRQANRLAALPTAAQGMPAAVAAPAPVVGGKAFPDAASAQAAATTANTPQAIRARQVAALQGIDPERAMKLEDASMGIEQKARALQQEGVFDGLKAFRAGDAVGMKEALNKSGQFKIDGDVTLTPEVREIPGVGKITTYNATFNAVGPDGKIVPRQVNSHDLSMQMMPFEKALELQQKGAKEAREGKKTDAEITKLAADAREADAKAGYYTQVGNVKANGGADGKPYKLDEDDKLRLTTANTRVRDAEKAYGEALGKLMPGDKPETNPAVQFAGQQLRAAKLDHLRTNIELGQIKPEAMVNQILGVAKSPQDVMKSLSELATVGGAEFSDQVAAQIQKTDAWKRMNGGGATSTGAPKTTAGKKIAQAPAGSVVLQPDGSYAPPGTRGPSGVAVATEAPAVTAGGIPRDPNARATKLRTSIAAEQGMPMPREQAVKAAAAASAAAKTATDAYRVADMPGFQYLPTEEQIRIANLAKGQ